MKITGVRTRLYEFEMARPLGDANLPTGSNRAAGLPNHLMMEVVAAGREACFTVDQRIEDGYIVLGETPGLGMVFDEERLARLEVDRLTPGLTAGSWGRRRGAGLFEVGPNEPEELN